MDKLTDQNQDHNSTHHLNGCLLVTNPAYRVITVKVPYQIFVRDVMPRTPRLLLGTIPLELSADVQNPDGVHRAGDNMGVGGSGDGTRSDSKPALADTHGMLDTP